jgi:hypothetical protein
VKKMAGFAIQNGFFGEKMAIKNEVLKSIPFSIGIGAFTQNSNFLGELEWL